MASGLLIQLSKQYGPARAAVNQPADEADERKIKRCGAEAPQRWSTRSIAGAGVAVGKGLR
jgi:hypothetical protein